MTTSPTNAAPEPPAPRTFADRALAAIWRLNFAVVLMAFAWIFVDPVAPRIFGGVERKILPPVGAPDDGAIESHPDRSLAFVGISAFAVLSTAALIASLFFGPARHRSVHSWLKLTALVALWLGLFGFVARNCLGRRPLAPRPPARVLRTSRRWTPRRVAHHLRQVPRARPIHRLPHRQADDAASGVRRRAAWPCADCFRRTLRSRRPPLPTRRQSDRRLARMASRRQPPRLLHWRSRNGLPARPRQPPGRRLVPRPLPLAERRRV